MMKYRILLLPLIIALAAAACTNVGEVETAVTATTAQQASIAVEQDAGAADVQTTEPSPTQEPAPTKVPVLPVIGPAPRWDNEVWINSDGPLPLEDLRGKVVLLEFWTFG